MQMLVLSRSAKIASTKRLVEAGREKGHTVKVLNPVKIEMHLEGARARLLHHGKELKVPQVVLPRVAPSVANYGLAVVDQFALLGAAVMNSARAIGQSRNPLRCLQLLSSNGVDIPSTLMARDAADLKASVSRVGGVPVLVKLLHGQERKGVMVCETLQSLEAALEAVLGLGQNLLMQQYVKTKEHDLRAIVVGGEVVAAVRRQTSRGRLRQSLGKGARLKATTLSDRQRATAELAAQLCELEVCAVDMLDTKKGPKVFEVNSSPAIPEIEEATGVDIAGTIVARAETLLALRAKTS